MSNEQFELTEETIMEDPHRFGLPTYEEFCKNPAKWRDNPEQSFIDADRGSTMLRQSIVKYMYVFRCWETYSLETMERILGDHGLKPKDVKMKPELIYLGAGKIKCIIEFVEKKEDVAGIL